jgi:hypothetical protein
LPGNREGLVTGAAKASAGLSVPVEADHDLQVIVNAWATLPKAIRAGIMAMVKAAEMP